MCFYYVKRRRAYVKIIRVRKNNNKDACASFKILAFIGTFEDFNSERATRLIVSMQGKQKSLQDKGH